MLFNLKQPNSKLIRWRLKLEEFAYDIVYKKGKFNTNADCFSPIPIHTQETESVVNNPGDVDKEIFKNTLDQRDKRK